MSEQKTIDVEFKAGTRFAFGKNWLKYIESLDESRIEVAKPETILALVRAEGFELTNLKTCAGGLGCNEYVFQRKPTAAGISCRQP